MSHHSKKSEWFLNLRDKKILHRFGYDTPYLAGGHHKHLHIVGTRAGGSVIAFWAIMKYLGREGFMKVVNKCMENTKFLAKNIEELEGIRLAADPMMNIVGITTENGERICDLYQELKKRKWMLGLFKNLNLIRIVVMPHDTKSHLSNFIDDLKIILRNFNNN